MKKFLSILAASIFVSGSAFAMKPVTIIFGNIGQLEIF